MIKLPNKLLPCPFCGSAAEIVEYDILGSPCFYVACEEIECRGCGSAPLTKHARRKEAIVAWNTRAPCVQNVETEESGKVPLTSPEALERFKQRYDGDAADAMTEEEWGQWVDALPKDEFWAMMELGLSEVKA